VGRGCWRTEFAIAMVSEDLRNNFFLRSKFGD
jgi:hypothetical protein